MLLSDPQHPAHIQIVPKPRRKNWSGFRLIKLRWDYYWAQGKRYTQAGCCPAAAPATFSSARSAVPSTYIPLSTFSPPVRRARSLFGAYYLEHPVPSLAGVPATSTRCLARFNFLGFPCLHSFAICSAIPSNQPLSGTRSFWSHQSVSVSHLTFSGSHSHHLSQDTFGVGLPTPLFSRLIPLPFVLPMR